MPRNNRPGRKRRRGNRGLRYTFEETYHGQISAGSTVAVGLPSDLPKFRPFRPVRVVVDASGIGSPCVVQVALYDRDNKRCSTSGPRLCGTTPHRVIVTYGNQPTFSSDYSANSALYILAIDHLCTEKASTASLRYVARLYFRYGEEEEQEKCPAFHSTFGPTDMRGRDLGSPNRSGYSQDDLVSDFEKLSVSGCSEPGSEGPC